MAELTTQTFLVIFLPNEFPARHKKAQTIMSELFYYG